MVVTLKEFRAFFPDINDNYVTSFLPDATLEEGRSQMSYTRYVIRTAPGVYLVHPDVFES
ncbi:MAG TPA: hypothetical protein ENJ08_00600 [Gammaproteobacteria bacterium]|nr:hypothetical protein [Gammaproteobacteria bacterium]